MFGWGKREQAKQAKAERSVHAEEAARYQDRPLLKLLENYVLDCIGELPPQEQQHMASVVPSVFGGDADWKKTLRDTLQLEEAIDEAIRQNWRQNQDAVLLRDAFGGAGQEPAAVSYAKQFVDDNFAHLIG